MPRYRLPEGYTLQAFQFALDPTPEQSASIARHFGARRKARNWALATIKADIDHYNKTGEPTPPPSLYGLRKRWNAQKNEICVNPKTQEVWWPECSKEAYADGISGTVDGYWRWQKSRAGKQKGKRMGFPRFAKKGKDRDRYSVSTGGFRLVDRRHIQIPVVGVVRLHENARKLDRLIEKGQARILGLTIRRSGKRLLVTCRVEVRRPQQPRPRDPDSVVGIDMGVRRLATVAKPDGTIIQRVENPRALEGALGELRRLNRQKSRRTPGSSRHRATKAKISQAYARVAAIRKHHIHVLTSELAKTHGQVNIEDLNVAGMLRQKGLPGARVRRRRLLDAALGEQRRQLMYKCSWYGSELRMADRWYPSSQICSGCGHRQSIGWAEIWQCDGCGVRHDRDDNAAINIARLGDLGSVGAPVKQGADRKTGPRPAGGEELRKKDLVPSTPRRGVAA